MSDSLPSRTSLVQVTNFPEGGTVSGTVTSNQGTPGATPWPVSDGGVSLTVDGTVAVSGTVATSSAALPLPSGASTETTLALIKAKTDNLDVALSTRTKPADTQTVAGTVTANAGTGTMAVSGPLTDTQLRASAVPVSGTLGVSGTVPVSGPLTDSQLRASAVPVSGTFYQATQPISGTVVVSGTVPVSGTFFQATQPVSGTVTANAGSGTMAVSGPLTDSQLRASAVPVSGAFFQAIQPISVAALPLPSGAALEAGNLATLVTSATQAVETLAANTARNNALLPTTALQVARVKVATGEYGVDMGDVSNRNPLPVEAASQRRLQELQLICQLDSFSMSLAKRSNERVNSQFSTRGVR